jgi:hypothetical protein
MGSGASRDGARTAANSGPAFRVAEQAAVRIQCTWRGYVARLNPRVTASWRKRVQLDQAWATIAGGGGGGGGMDDDNCSATAAANASAAAAAAAAATAASSATMVQAVVRGWSKRRHLTLLRKAAMHIQRAWRGWSAVLRALLAKQQDRDRAAADHALGRRLRDSCCHSSVLTVWAALRIQAKARMIRARREFRAVRLSVVRLQQQARRRQARSDFLRMRFAVTTAQRVWRGKVGRREYSSVWGECSLAALRIQAKFRARAAARELRATRHALVRVQACCRGRAERRRRAEERAGCLRMLAPELLEEVFGHLLLRGQLAPPPPGGGARALCAVRCVCTRWRAVVQACQPLWRQLSSQLFGAELARAAADRVAEDAPRGGRGRGGDQRWQRSCVSLGRLSDLCWLPSTGPAPAPLPPMPFAAHGHTLTAVDDSTAVLLFGKAAGGTGGQPSPHLAVGAVLHVAPDTARPETAAAAAEEEEEGQRRASAAATGVPRWGALRVAAVSAAFLSCVWPILAGIHLCHACSCYAIEGGDAPAGGGRRGHSAAAVGALGHTDCPRRGGGAGRCVVPRLLPRPRPRPPPQRLC